MDRRRRRRHEGNTGISLRIAGGEHVRWQRPKAWGSSLEFAKGNKSSCCMAAVLRGKKRSAPDGVNAYTLLRHTVAAPACGGTGWQDADGDTMGATVASSGGTAGEKHCCKPGSWALRVSWLCSNDVPISQGRGSQIPSMLGRRSPPQFKNRGFLTAGFKIWKEHISVSSTLIIAPLLSNSPQ